MARRAYRCFVLLALVAFGLPSLAARGQAPQKVPFPLNNPEEFFERVFGKETEADRRKIAQVSISPREEAHAGRTALEAFRTQLRQQRISVDEKGDDVKYVKQLVGQLRPLMQHARRYRRIEVLVADTDDTDARSFPGGWIVVSRGLIDFCESEAALVGVLGHELSHIDHGHQLFHLRRWKLAHQSLSGPLDPERMLTASGIMAQMFMQPFRPEMETQADEDGARWAFQLGYDPDELARMFLSLQQRDGRHPNFMPSFLRSHPVHEDRFRAIAKLAETLKGQQPAKDMYVGRENLKRRIPRSRQMFAE